MVCSQNRRGQTGCSPRARAISALRQLFEPPTIGPDQILFDQPPAGGGFAVAIKWRPNGVQMVWENALSLNLEMMPFTHFGYRARKKRSMVHEAIGHAGWRPEALRLVTEPAIPTARNRRVKGIAHGPWHDPQRGEP